MLHLIICIIASIIFGSLISVFLKLAYSKHGKDFSIKEFVKNIKLKNIDIKYILIYFITLYCISCNVSIPNAIICIPFCFAMILAFILDTLFMIIPDTSNIVIILCGILNNIINFSKENIISSLLGFLLGLVTFLIINVICRIITKKDGFGMGDIKLLASLGLFFGFKGIIVVMILSVILSALFSIFFLIYRKIKKTKSEYIPFGPFIVISSFIVYIISYERIIQMYFNIINKIIT